MKHITVILLLLLTIEFYAYSEVKEVISEGIVYNVNTDSRTASVGKNYTVSIVSGNNKYEGTLSGDVIIPATVKYRGRNYPVTSIDNDAFNYCCYLVSVTIPSSVTTLNNSLNALLPRLEAINVLPGNNNYISVDGVLFSGDMKKIIRYPISHTGDRYVIPSSVLSIEKDAFTFCSRKEIVLPSGLEIIKSFAFSCSDITGLILPDNVSVIDAYAFYSCDSLVTITIPESVTSLGTNAFAGCSGLESIVCRNIDLKITPEMTTGCDKLNGRIVYGIPPHRIKELAESFNAEQQYTVATYYLKGRGVEKSQASAIEWLEKSAVAGYELAQVTLGDMYLKGQGVSKDLPTALKWYSLAAENGNSKLQSFLGDCYMNAVGVDADTKKAAGYYLQAAMQGDTNAIKMTGYCYYNGKGVSQDYPEAVKWYKKSAQNGDAESAYFVAMMYNEGKGLAKDDAQALTWAKRAADKGSQEGLWLYTRLVYDDAVRNMGEKQYEAAISGFTSLLGYDKDNTDACINRGYCYMMIKPADYSLAEADFNRALELDEGNTVARDNLKVVSEQKKKLDEAKKLITEGNTFFWGNDYVNAVSCFTRSIYIDETNPYPYCAIGYCFFSCEQYGNAIGFFDKAISLDPNYNDAKKAKEAALTQIYNKAIENVSNSYSNSLNNAYNNNLSNGNSYNNNTLNNVVDRSVERNNKYSDNQYNMYMRLYDQEKAEADSYFRKYELYGNLDDLKRSKSCQTRANDYLEKANIWK